jgi:cobalt/nickel transport system permease protein
MALVHAGIGVGEALITGMVLRFILMTRADLIYDETEAVGSEASRRVLGGFQVAAAGLGIALAVAVFLGPFAWDAPDGLEFVGQRLSFLGPDVPPAIPSPLLDYELPGLVQHSPRLATAAAGAIGTVVVFGFGLTLASVFNRRGHSALAPPGPRQVSPDAA